MPSATDQQDTVESRIAEARKLLKYEYLLPPPSAEMVAKMSVAEAPSDEAAAGDSPPGSASRSLEQIAALLPVQYPPLDEAAARDKALGCFLGLAIGDAVGTTVEFQPRGSFPALTDLIGDGPFNLKPGEWTDDTTMALCLAESLLADENVDQLDLMNRFRALAGKRGKHGPRTVL